MQAKLANGILLKINTSGSTFVTIPGVTMVNHPGPDFDLPDVSDHDLDLGQYNSRIPGNFSGARITFEGNHRINDTIHQLIEEANENADLVTFKLIYPEISLNTRTFDAFVKITGRSNRIKQPMTWQVTLDSEGPSATS